MSSHDAFARLDRRAVEQRKSKETRIAVELRLDPVDGGEQRIATGLPFFDHLLEAFARHARFTLIVDAEGDLHIDSHHTVEDTGIVLGRALKAALADKTGIERMGDSLVPMDEALVRAVVDLGGRSSLSFQVEVPGTYTPTIDLTVLEGFWKAVCDGAGMNLHVDCLRGRDYHHIVEATFKACGRALRAASRPDGTARVPTTKELFDG
jgi:imidazoleglycerol-phosphate dehydratase